MAEWLEQKFKSLGETKNIIAQQNAQKRRMDKTRGATQIPTTLQEKLRLKGLAEERSRKLLEECECPDPVVIQAKSLEQTNPNGMKMMSTQNIIISIVGAILVLLGIGYLVRAKPA